MVRAAGLLQQFRRHEAVRFFIHKIRALAFLPTNDVPVGMQYLWGIVEDLPCRVVSLLLRFDASYVSGKRRRPRFPPALWNVYNATLAGAPRTNNLCEGWNHGTGSTLAIERPRLADTIKRLQQDELQVHQQIVRFKRGEVALVRRRSETDADIRRLFAVSRRYRDGLLS